MPLTPGPRDRRSLDKTASRTSDGIKHVCADPVTSFQNFVANNNTEESMDKETFHWLEHHPIPGKVLSTRITRPVTYCHSN